MDKRHWKTYNDFLALNLPWRCTTTVFHQLLLAFTVRIFGLCDLILILISRAHVLVNELQPLFRGIDIYFYI
jgi:hypothetical protein